jgi:hypothetical protein
VTYNTDQMHHFPEAPYRTFLLIMHTKTGLGQLPPDDKVSENQEPIQAHVSFGRWCISCPDCGSAVVAEPTDPFFCCTACGSRGEWIQVVFPVEDLRQQIETVLLLRPGFRNNAPSRNWDRSESVDDLRRQNIAAGDLVDRLPVDEPSNTRGE